MLSKNIIPQETSQGSNQADTDMTFNTLTVLVRDGVGLRPTQELPFIEHGITTYKRTRQTDRQTDNQAISTEVGKV